jgi:hypothetical protein
MLKGLLNDKQINRRNLPDCFLEEILLPQGLKVKIMGYWGDLVNDVRTHFVPNSKDYQILKALLLTDNQQSII